MLQATCCQLLPWCKADFKADFKFTPRESSKKLCVKRGIISGKEKTEDVIRLMRNSFQLSTVFQRFVFLEGGVSGFCALHRATAI
jgi:hypothetical protein